MKARLDTPDNSYASVARLRLPSPKSLADAAGQPRAISQAGLVRKTRNYLSEAMIFRNRLRDKPDFLNPTKSTKLHPVDGRSRVKLAAKQKEYDSYFNVERSNESAADTLVSATVTALGEGIEELLSGHHLAETEVSDFLGGFRVILDLFDDSQEEEAK